MFKLKIYNYLLRNHNKEIFTANISNSLKCSKMLVSKTLKELIAKNICIKESKNTARLINPFLLATHLAFSENLAEPLFFEIPDYKDLTIILSKTLYSITLDSALEILNHKTPNKVYAHIKEQDVELLFDYLNPLSKESSNCLVIYPAKFDFFISQQFINGVLLANNYQLIIDLLRTNKTEKVIKLLKDEKLLY